MIADHEIFSQQGSIGDCELRNQTEKFLFQLGIPDTNIVWWMDRLMFDVYRNFAMTSKLQTTIDHCIFLNRGIIMPKYFSKEAKRLSQIKFNEKQPQQISHDPQEKIWNQYLFSIDRADLELILLCDDFWYMTTNGDRIL
jgi:hypothetical protein